METFEAFLIRKDTMRAFLQANRSGPPPAEMYHIAKEWVKHIPLMLTAITHFEMGHPLAIDQTYEEIIVHLSNIAESNAGAITVHHAINEMKQVPTLAEAVANEVRRQMVNTTSKGDTGRAQRLSTAVAKMIRSETSIDDAVMKRLIRNVTNIVHQDCGSEIKTCKHHPFSTSHTTAECAIETGVRKQPKQRGTAS